MCGHSLILQQISQCLCVIQCIALVGTLTGAEDQVVLFCLGQCQLVGNAVLLQVGKGRAAQHHVVAVGAPEAGQVVDAAHAHSTCKQGGTAQTAVDGVVSAQVHTGSPDPGALFGVVQGQNAGSQLSGQVDEILFLQLGAAALGQITVQKTLAVHGICAEQLHLALVQQLGNGIGHPVVLPVVKTAAAGGQCQHRHTGMAVHLKLHLTAKNRAPLFVIGTLDHKSSTPYFIIHRPGHSRCAPVPDLEAIIR